eukprot:TRINITY_DN2783_c0_g1_i3.p1 TRINITY_DN2783_c0_g1~~TRINITY_DN2783_c0_g1_i3.p1  ORF type:complete len:224 (-),score=31.29 TRINITY_DN2783_c0_g1_i3:378-1049(-)
MGIIPQMYSQDYRANVSEFLFENDLNEAVVNNYGTMPPEAFGCFVRLGASINSRGNSWHQGWFDDIFFELIEAQNRLPRAPRVTYPAHARSSGDHDHILFIAIYYHQFERAQLLLECGAYAGPDRIYRVNVLQFLSLVFLVHNLKFEEEKEWKLAQEEQRLPHTYLNRFSLSGTELLPEDWDRRVTQEQLHPDCEVCVRFFKFQTWCEHHSGLCCAKSDGVME